MRGHLVDRSQQYGTGATPWSLIAADLTGDGIPDLAVANIDDATVSVLVNQGNGTFAASVDHAVGGDPVSVVARDLNNDGRRDVVVADYSSNDVSIVYGHCGP